MSERTPPMSAIRSAWAKAHPFPLTTDVDERYAEFDRALAAHDAEVLHRAALFLRGSENPRQSDNTVQAVRHSMDDAGYELLQLSKRVATGAGVVAEEPAPVVMETVAERVAASYAASHARLANDPEYQRLKAGAEQEERLTPGLFFARNYFAIYVEVHTPMPLRRPLAFWRASARRKTKPRRT